MWNHVVSNGCGHGQPFGQTKAAQRLDLELMLGALAMAVELWPVPWASVDLLGTARHGSVQGGSVMASLAQGIDRIGSPYDLPRHRVSATQAPELGAG
jgi:hypothetical protein